MSERQLAAYGCWIQGKTIQGNKLYPLINPSTGTPFALATAADASLADLALTGAQEAFHLWRSRPMHHRADLLHALAGLIRREEETLASLVCEEVGKPLQAARDEVLSTASLIDYFAEESLRLTGYVPLLGHPREQVLIVREPVGVVVAITPFNYPLSTLASKVGPALAVGCTVVAKPDEHTPLSTLKMAQLASEAGLPPGVFNVLTGWGPEVGRYLVENPVPRLVTFTGSTAVGKEIQAAGARWVRKTILELGGYCPAILGPNAPWREVLPQLVAQSLKNCGQYCYRISRIYVADSLYEEFLQAFLDRVSRLHVGPATEPFVDIGPLNHADVLEQVHAQVQKAVSEGAVVRCGGEVLRSAQGGFFYSPTVLTDVQPGMSIVQEEVFGPVVIISSFQDVRSAIEEANGTRYGLAAYLFAADLSDALAWAAQLDVGSVWINRIHQAYPQAPFGGMKESGLGREKSRFGLEEYTELKTLYLSY